MKREAREEKHKAKTPERIGPLERAYREINRLKKENEELKERIADLEIEYVYRW